MDGCILPTQIVDITMCYMSIRLAQNSTQKLIGGEQKPTPTFNNVLAG